MIQQLSLVDLMDENGHVKNELHNTSAFCTTKLTEPVIKYFTFQDTVDMAKHDALFDYVVKEQIKMMFDISEYNEIVEVPDAKLQNTSMISIKEASETIPKELEKLEFLNYFNPFSKVHKKIDAEWIKATIVEVGFLGGIGLGIGFYSTAPGKALFYGGLTAVALVEGDRRRQYANNKRTLELIAESAAMYNTFQDNLARAVVKPEYSAKARELYINGKYFKSHESSPESIVDLNVDKLNMQLLNVYGRDALIGKEK